jgi:hypothetical protein
MQATARQHPALALAAWDACGGDPLLALSYALNVVSARIAT